MAERDTSRARLLDRAARDPAFEQLLLSDVNAAIKLELGIVVPPGITIQVLQDTDDTVYLVLPPRVKGPDQGEAGIVSGWITWSAQSNNCSC